MTKYFFLDQHGCAKNQVDGELIIGILTGLGWCKTAEPEQAHLIIVNSCGFIEPAKRESIEAVVTARAAYPYAKILLAGCLAERYGDIFQTDLEEADAFFGNGDLSQLPRLIAELFPEPETGGSSNKAAVSVASHTAPRPFIKPPQEGISCGVRPELLNFPRSAFIKITEGCNNCCTFCAIPLIRGSVRSRSIASIVDEIRDFVQKGYKEFNLIGQDLAVYEAESGWTALRTPLSVSANPKRQPRTGITAPDAVFTPVPVQRTAGKTAAVTDTASASGVEHTQDRSRRKEPQPELSGLARLLQAISALTGDFSVRLLYIHPDHFPLDILPIMTADTRFLPYFDIPFQSGSESIIHAMNRCGSAAVYLEMVETIRAAFRNAKSPYGEAVIRTTFLTGFPGETQEDFEQTASFLQAVQSLWSGAFVYSREEGTKAALMKKRVPVKIAEKRKELLNELQLHITEEKLTAFCGAELTVLIEEVISQSESADISGSPSAEYDDSRIALGRVWFQAPEVDGAVVVNFTESQKDTEGNPIQPGSTVRVRITALRGIDLEADVLNQ
ncbi:MAG: MiaB/RimO family radical SAM methylthiotransferase [Treponema sp.]|uniref:MiaB/RimO family radical SAM methylthiotransferase n=1 Tax=Treponema sp. TaxID=166 RepID=UPI003FA292B3